MPDKYLQRLNIKQLKPMQEEALKVIKKKSDTILLSPTGSGKTLAFLLPLLKMLDESKAGIQAIIITPSRELALQIEGVFKEMQTGFKVTTCYGGHPILTEKNRLKIPPALMIGTPGRISDHLRRNNFDPSSITAAVLDEFDKSLELGFREEMSFILRSCYSIDTRILTSATLKNDIPEFTGITNPVILDYSEAGKTGSVLNVKAVRAEDSDKLSLLIRLISFLEDKTSLVFCNHREAVERISELLEMKDIPHGKYHGGMEQEYRELAIIKFRNGSHRILLTTDLASRGLDIPEISNVIHYQLPGNETSWIHRNGRTARMEKDGSAWLVLAKDDYIPGFLNEEVPFIDIPDNPKTPPAILWETLYISAGKKDKISKGDIAGYLMQKGMLHKDDIGRIDVLDHASFAAIKRDEIRPLIKQLEGYKLKNKTVKTDIAK